MGRSESLIRKVRPDKVILLAGIYDITAKDGQSAQISLQHTSVNYAVQLVLDQIHEAIKSVCSICNAKVSVTTVTGVDLADCNYFQRRRMNNNQHSHYVKTIKQVHHDQSKLNEIIMSLNRMIVSINSQTNTPIVWAASAVHPHSGKTYSHYYGKLRD